MKLLILLFALAVFPLLWRTRCIDACARKSADHWRLHRRAAHAALGAALALVILVESLVRLEGETHRHPLLPLHLGFTVPFLLLLLVQAFGPRQWRSPSVGAGVPIASLVLYTGTFLTGLVMLAGDFFS